jgi:hypothetical protein
MSPDLVKSFADLLALLARDGVPHEPNPTARSVHIPTEHKGVAGVQLVRWQDADAVLQFIQSMSVEIPEDRVAAVASATLRLNHALAWPGLDLDEDSRRLAFRVVLPLLPRGGVEPREIQTCFRIAVSAAADLGLVLQRVASGAMAPTDIVAEVARDLAAQTGID